MTTSSNLIYGLIDPRTLLIRYIGLSSNGMKRPRNHRNPSCPDTYCRRWVKSLQREGLTYQIVVLEMPTRVADLPEAERWWIAYGRACDWPLTNLTEGGGPSEAAIVERGRRNRERDLANTRRNRITLERLAEIQEENRRWKDRLRRLDPLEVKKDCFAMFEKYRHSQNILVDVIIHAKVTPDTARQLYDEWLKT